jgi:hypothetical protein
VPSSGENQVHAGELYPQVGLIVTNLARPVEPIAAFKNRRGTAAQWIKEVRVPPYEARKVAVGG